MFNFTEETKFLTKYRVIEEIEKFIRIVDGLRTNAQSARYIVQKFIIDDNGPHWIIVKIFPKENDALDFYNKLADGKINEDGQRILAQS